MTASNEQSALQPALQWHGQQLPKALQFIARAYHLPTAHSPSILPTTEPEDAPTRWLPPLARKFHMDARPQDIAYEAMLAFLRQPAAAIIPHGHAADGTPRYVVVLRGGRWRVSVLCADGTQQHFRPDRLRDMLFPEDRLSHPTHAHSAALMEAIRLPAERQARLRRQVLAAHHQQQLLAGAWRVHVDWHHQPIGWQIRRAGVVGALGGLILLNFTSFLIFFIALLLISRSVVVLPLAWGILLAGLAVWLMHIPVGMVMSWLLRRVAVQVGVLLNVQLFGGLQALKPDEIAQAGAGHWLHKALQANQFLDSWLNRGAWFVYAVVFLSVSALMLLLTGAPLLSGVLVVWVVAAVGWVAFIASRNGTLQEHIRDYNTKQLERLQAHDTRQVQERDWFTVADQQTGAVLRDMLAQDRRYTALWMVVPYGALVLMLVAVAVDFVPLGVPFAASAVPAFQLALVLLLLSQLQYLAISTPDMVQMVTSWRQTQDLRRPQPESGASEVVLADIAPRPDDPFIELQDVGFAYEADRPVLVSCSAIIRVGDHIVLEGASGAGKTTLAQLLSGLRPAQRGLLLMHGYDWHTIGNTAWRSQVVLAPQFYQNHIFDASLAFNLLMGRGWPASDEDIAEAEAVCEELGLSALLAAMPQGIHQPVGERGWQLSHGERNRVFVARALLQPAECLILDESLAALDPASYQAVLACVRRRARTLLIITQEG